MAEAVLVTSACLRIHPLLPSPFPRFQLCSVLSQPSNATSPGQVQFFFQDVRSDSS